MAPLPEAACSRTRVPEGKSRQGRGHRGWQRQQGTRWGGRGSIGAPGAALLTGYRWERAASPRPVVLHMSELRRRVTHMRHIVRMLVKFSWPKTSAATGPVPIPPPDGQTHLGLIIADLPVFELPFLSRGMSSFQIHVVRRSRLTHRSLLAVNRKSTDCE